MCGAEVEEMVWSKSKNLENKLKIGYFSGMLQASRHPWHLPIFFLNSIYAYHFANAIWNWSGSRIDAVVVDVDVSSIVTQDECGVQWYVGFQSPARDRASSFELQTPIRIYLCLDSDSASEIKLVGGMPPPQPITNYFMWTVVYCLPIDEIRSCCRKLSFGRWWVCIWCTLVLMLQMLSDAPAQKQSVIFLWPFIPG
jgi:hypothetical protein